MYVYSYFVCEPLQHIFDWFHSGRLILDWHDVLLNRVCKRLQSWGYRAEDWVLRSITTNQRRWSCTSSINDAENWAKRAAKFAAATHVILAWRWNGFKWMTRFYKNHSFHEEELRSLVLALPLSFWIISGRWHQVHVMDCFSVVLIVSKFCQQNCNERPLMYWAYLNPKCVYILWLMDLYIFQWKSCYQHICYDLHRMKAPCPKFAAVFGTRFTWSLKIADHISIGLRKYIESCIRLQELVNRSRRRRS